MSAPIFDGDHKGTINTATTGVTQTAGNNSTLIATTAYADAAAAAIPIGNYLPLAGGTLTGNLTISVPDSGGAPAMTNTLFMKGYEGRGIGMKIRDSANSATSPSNREWFVGSGYSNSGFNIGYSATGSASSYSAQSKFNITTSGVVTIPGDVGIGVTGPGHKLDVEGVVRARQGQLIGANSFTDEAQTAFFTNGVSDLNVDIVLPNASLWGYLEVDVTGFYNNQDAHGKLTKIYAMGLNVGGTIFSSESRVSDAVGPVNANVNLGPIRWDSATSTYRIRLAHIVSTGNNFAVKISAFTISGKALSLPNSWSLSPLYTESTAGLTQQYVYYNDRLGIGTSTPSAKLDIQGTQGQLFSVTDDLSGDIFSVADISGVPIMNVNSDGTSYLDGKVYINATASIPNRTEEFQVTGRQIITNTGTDGPALYLGYNSSGSNSIQLGRGRTADGLSYIDLNGEVMAAGDYGFRIMRNAGVNAVTMLNQVGTGNLQINAANGADTVFTNTNVGINITNPNQKLHVNDGGIRVEKNATGLGGFVSVGNATEQAGNYSAYYFGNTASDNNYFKGGIAYETLASTYGRGDMHFLQNSTTSNGIANISDSVMTILNGGNVGIGTTGPLVKLHVNQGNVSGTVIKASGIQAQIEIQTSTAGDAHLYMRPNSTGNNAAIFKMTAGTNYNWRWQDDASTPVVFMQLSQSNSSLSVKGDIIAYGSPSDERYKENIKPIESALDKAVKLQGVTFDWKESDSILDIKEDIGFIAQDVQKVVPELVRENEDGKLSLRYQGVTPILLEAIKELKAEIDLLKSKPCNCNNCNCSI